jgi:hypothetical protein
MCFVSSNLRVAFIAYRESRTQRVRDSVHSTHTLSFTFICFPLQLLLFFLSANGRVHTSTVTVAVLPEATEEEVKVEDRDIRIDVYRSSGAGGQHVNTTEVTTPSLCSLSLLQLMRPCGLLLMCSYVCLRSPSAERRASHSHSHWHCRVHSKYVKSVGFLFLLADRKILIVFIRRFTFEKSVMNNF